MQTYQCRICGRKEQNRRALITPCECKDDKMFVHQRCLTNAYIGRQTVNDNSDACPFCNTKYVHDLPGPFGNWTVWALLTIGTINSLPVLRMILRFALLMGCLATMDWFDYNRFITRGVQYGMCVFASYQSRNDVPRVASRLRNAYNLNHRLIMTYKDLGYTRETAPDSPDRIAS